MKAQQTAGKAHVTERQKAWARLALLTVVGLVCPPLAAARSGAVWASYLLLAVLYSAWAVRAVRGVTRDRYLGYLFCLTDGLVLLPIFVWSIGAAMRVVLVLLWSGGVLASWRAARAGQHASRVRDSSRRAVGSSSPSAHKGRSRETVQEAPLERALRVRLRSLQEEKTRFGLVLLRVAGHEAIVAEYGDELSKELLRDVGRRGLRVLGADAQLFILPGGRIAFVFATDFARDQERALKNLPAGMVAAHDVESLAMALARRSCEKTLGGHRLECVVGWASAPADGMTADDLLYAAESGVLSSAAFRRVGGSPVPVPEPERRRAVAG